jgi:hypothetical protein
MDYKDLRKQIESLNNLKKDCSDPIVSEMIEQALLILDKAVERLANANQ